MTNLLPVKILLIEDSEEDAFFLMRQLNKNGYKPDYKQIETSDELRSSLSSDKWDLIITDHTLPDFNSIEAVKILNETKSDIPLIVLSGTIDQSVAIESMRLGARDFIMKDDTSRLIPAIKRELNEVNTRKLLRQSELKLKSDLQGLMDHSPAVIYVKDTSGTYTFINDQAERLFNIEKEDFFGKTDHEIFSQEDANMLSSSDKEIINTGKTIEIEEKLILNGKCFIFNSIKYPLFDNEGTIYAICGISTDITDKKQQEEKLRRSQKMEAIGQLSGGIAHDFNNQLGVVTGYLEFLKEYHSENKKPLNWVTNAEHATLHCIDLTRQLLAFSRKKSTVKTVVNINSAFHDFTDMIKRSVTPQVEVVFSLNDDLWLTEIDIGEFQDVILNLVINARDAMPKGGTLTIETKNVYLEDNEKFVNKNNQNEFVQLIISDNGSGMKSETMEHIFEPFFTTKAVGKGTGLGLSMIYGFIRSYNGDINVYSELGIGTTFKISLPRSGKELLSEASSNNQTTELPRGTETILIVDDEPGLLHIANLHITKLGYKTYLAENAAQALTILEKENITLLFSDVVMPGGMDGYELATLTQKNWPTTKIIMTSGFTSESIENNSDHTNIKLLSKPYRGEDLARIIRQTLDE